jgi:DNA-binding FrmR family transcriptional regulator
MKNDQLIIRLRKIRGQLEGIERMLENGRGCEEVVLQIQAIRSALASLGQELVKEEVKGCDDDASQQAQIARLQSLVSEMFKLT